MRKGLLGAIMAAVFGPPAGSQKPESARQKGDPPAVPELPPVRGHVELAYTANDNRWLPERRTLRVLDVGSRESDHLIGAARYVAAADAIADAQVAAGLQTRPRSFYPDTPAYKPFNLADRPVCSPACRLVSLPAYPTRRARRRARGRVRAAGAGAGGG